MGFEGVFGSFIVFVMFECIFFFELICCCMLMILFIIGMFELFGRCILVGVCEVGVYYMKIISKFECMFCFYLKMKRIILCIMICVY